MSYNGQMAAHVGRDGTFDALGKTWHWSRWDRKVWVDLTRRAREALPNPVEEMARHVDKLALAESKMMREVLRQDEEEKAKYGDKAILMSPRYKSFVDSMTSQALDKATRYLTFDSAEMQSFLNSVEGIAAVFHLLLRKHHQDMTEDLAFDVAEAIGTPRVKEILLIAQGELPPEPQKKSESCPAAGSSNGNQNPAPSIGAALINA